MKANICQVCGGKLKNFGTYFRCENCDTEYRIDESLSQDDMDAYFRRLNDFEDAERNLDVMPPRFDEAESEFERIIRKYPDWSAGYWGLVRSKFGIKFENDLDGKAVPSCYKSTYEDFCDTDEYNMAVELAETEELRQSYIKWAEYIARVTKEWRQTAQKYNYDVFISFKASEDSDGRETRDAREMHKLYDLIRDKGYRVFFSPVSLVAEGVAGKGSEPYIFNALDKAKALIVYGSRKEYFTSTWVQNEWQRYLRLIKEGKKEKGSLLVLYQRFNPKELPQGLRRIQGIEYGISAWPAISAVLEQILNKGKNEKAVAEEAVRKAEEKRRAEDEKRKKDEESANKLRDMLAQFAQMQEELSRIKSFAAPASIIYADPEFEIKDGVLIGYSGTKKKIVIPRGIVSIASRVFQKENKITSISIPDTVANIGESAFAGCRNLVNITVAVENKFYSSAGNCLIEKVTKTLIRGCKNSVIPSDGSVLKIGDFAFKGCGGITDVVLPNCVVSIGIDAFKECSGLTSMEIPNSVVNVESGAFMRCNGLVDLTISNSIIRINDYTFSGCSGLIEITVPDSVMEIGRYAFNGCDRLISVTIPNSVKNIGNYAFIGCRSLKKIIIPQAAKIAHDTFDNGVKVVRR